MIEVNSFAKLFQTYIRNTFNLIIPFSIDTWDGGTIMEKYSSLVEEAPLLRV